MPAAWAVTRLVRAQLFGVDPADAFTMALAAIGIASVALMSGYLPARRAIGIDPMQASMLKIILSAVAGFALHGAAIGTDWPIAVFGVVLAFYAVALMLFLLAHRQFGTLAPTQATPPQSH